jgi:hypothetical protein
VDETTKPKACKQTSSSCSLRNRVGECADRGRKEVFSAPGGDESGHSDIVVVVEDIEARHKVGGTIASLANDRVETRRRVVLVEDEVFIIGPILLLECKAVGDITLVRDYRNDQSKISQTTSIETYRRQDRARCWWCCCSPRPQ